MRRTTHTAARALLALALLAAGAPGCAQKTEPAITPSAAVAAKADAVVQALGLLQATTIVLADQQAIPLDRARLVVQFTVDAARIAKSTPDGYVASILASLAVLKARLAEGEWGQLGPHFVVLQLALDALGGR